jgi:glucokinase
MKRMADLFLQVIQSSGISKEDIGGIGIGVPGVLDLEKGEVLFLPNLAGTWPHVPLQATIEKLTALPTTLLNDVRSITNGEWLFGAGCGVDTVAVFAIGTGIGGGLVIGGQLQLGIGGTACGFQWPALRLWKLWLSRSVRVRSGNYRDGAQSRHPRTDHDNCRSLRE